MMEGKNIKAQARDQFFLGKNKTILYYRKF